MVVFQESWVQYEVTVLHLGGGLSSCRRTQRYLYIYILLEEEPGPCPMTALLFLDCSSFVSVSPPMPINICWNLTFGTQGRSRRLNETYFLQTRIGGTEKICALEDPITSCSLKPLSYFIHLKKCWSQAYKVIS